jgi:hypothetical protein
MLRLLRVSAVGLGLLAAGCATYRAGGTDTIGPGYITGGGEWNTGGGISAVVRIFERDGATVVCGAWTTDRQSGLTVDRNQDVMAAASVYAGRTRLVQDLSFMRRLRDSDNLAGEQAACVTSAKSWRAAFAETGPRLQFPGMSFIEGDEEEGTFNVTFRQTRRAPIVH